MNEENKCASIRETEISREFMQLESEVSYLQSLVKELRDRLVCVLSEEVEQAKDPQNKPLELQSIKTEMGRRLNKLYDDTNITKNIIERIIERLEL
jgi:hypothetical protein